MFCLQMIMITHFKQSTLSWKISEKDVVKEVLVFAVIKHWRRWWFLSNLVAARVEHPIAGLAASKIWLFALDVVLRPNKF